MLLVNSLCAQMYNFKSYTVEDGLPQSQVFASYQDSDGFLWFGTNGGGLARFDGKEFVTYDSEDGLIDNRVLSITGWNKDKIIVGTLNGFSILDDGKFTSFGKQEGLSAEKVFSLVTYKRKIYIGTENGIFIYDTKDSTIQQFSEGQELAGNVVRSLYKDSKNRIWVGTDKGVSLIYKSKIHDVDFLKQFPLQSVKMISEDRKGNIWIAYKKGGVICYDGESIKHYNKENGLPSNNVSAIASGEENTMWLGMERDGVARIDSNGSIKLFNEENGLCSELVFSLSADYEGNIWIGTSGNGVCLYNNDAFSLFNNKLGLNSNIILASHQDKSGKYWFGTFEGLCSYDGEEMTCYSSKDGFKANRVTSIAEDESGKLYFTTSENGIITYNGKRFQSLQLDEEIENFTFISSFVDSKGSVWFGTFGNGVVRFENGQFNQFCSLLDDVHDIIYSYYEDAEGNVWVGTEQGVSYYDGVRFNYKIFDGTVNFPVHSIEGDENGVWLSGYGNGIYFVDSRKNDSIHHLTTKDGLLDKDIIAMKKDPYNRLWLATIKGLQRLDLTEFYDSNVVSLMKINHEDGFSGGECNPRSIYLDSNNYLWFGTINGVVRYNELGNVQTERKYPRIYFKDIKLGFESVDWSAYDAELDRNNKLPVKADLSYNENHLTFDYVGINFKNSDKIRYQYKLEGIDKDWSPISKLTSVTYPGINPGDYIFMVRAVNGNGVWSQGSAEFEFSISSPFWKTIWFYGLMIIAAIALFMLYSRRRTLALQRSKKMLEEQVLARTVEIVKQKEIIETKNKDITDSIRYAKRIQEAILPISSLLRKNIPQSFILYKPKDIVSGDFYWYAKRKTKFVLAAVDCTGHGVPGALMSVIGNSILKDVIKHNGITDPSKVLTRLNDEVLITLKQRNSQFDDHDGMDIGLVEYDLVSKKLIFSGANRPMYIVRKGELITVKGDGWPIGGFYKSQKQFNNNEVQLEEGDMVYLSSDGYADQFGGPRGKKFKTGQFKKLLVNIAEKDINQQKELLVKAHNDWKGTEDQVDDILIIGFRA